MKKFTAILLAVVMVFALGASAFAADTTPVTTKAVDTTLSVTVDYTIEGLYFDGTTLKSSATNGYYPFNFSFIVSDRTAVGSITVSNGGSFAWASDSEDSETESTTTTYGLVTLPTTSASTVTVTSASGNTLTISCAQPNGGTTAAGTALYAYLPAPAQFVNEGVTTGGWGDAYDSNGAVKATGSTGVSLGFFGGYAVYKFENPIADDPTHPYGADFIVYGNAFWNNSEAGCIQVSKDGTTWYDIAGSMYYTKSTKGATITYTNPNPSEDKGITAAASNKGTLAPVKYTLNGGAEQEITTNSFHNHSWFPLNANYFVDSGTRKEMAKVDEFSFVSRTLNSDNITSTLTFKGTLLTDYPGTGKTDQIGFGYCDVHPNRTLGSTIAYNPYQTFTSSSDYNTKTEGTGGGDPIDIAWAVKPNGTPANLGSIKYVRIYTGMAQMNGIFGEISTEVCGVAACTGSTTETAATPTITVNGVEKTAANGKLTRVTELGSSTCTVTASGNGYVYINGVATTSATFTPTENGTPVQIIVQNGEAAPYIAWLLLRA
ncbi:MAG: hypothetical protein U0N32_10225 [Oscillospiraceae bacterium]